MAYIGPDQEFAPLWHGQPGLVVDRADFDPDPEVSVQFVGGPSVGVRLELVTEIDQDTYKVRGERVIAGKHPVRDLDIGPPVTAEGSHWPIQAE